MATWKESSIPTVASAQLAAAIQSEALKFLEDVNRGEGRILKGDA
jgi:hypothetical protein